MFSYQLLQNAVSDNLVPARDLGLWPGLVRFLIGLHLSVKKKLRYRPAEEELWLLIFPDRKNSVLKHDKFLTRDLSPVCGTLSAFGRGFFNEVHLSLAFNRQNPAYFPQLYL